MKLISYLNNGLALWGVLKGENLADLSMPTGHSTLKSYLQHGGTIADLETLVDQAPLMGPASDFPLLPPVPDAGRIFGIGWNYGEHCAEQNQDLPNCPAIFMMPPTALTSHGATVLRPAVTTKLDYEGELGVVIGKTIRNATLDDALDAVFGYTIVNDVTARDLQNAEGQWTRAKGADGFAPCGPVIITADELGDPQTLNIETRVNGEVRQAACTSDMLFPVAKIIQLLTEVITLQPGDIISTGTPSGVGGHRNPPVFLQHGDVVEITIDRIGTLTSYIATEQP